MRLVGAGAALLVAAGAVVAFLLTESGREGRLAWAQKPQVLVPEGMARDRVLVADVRNDGQSPIDLRVDQVRVLDAGGRKLRSSARFAAAFGHGLYGPGGPPAPLQASRYDQRRLGEIVTIDPGEVRPLTVAWRGSAARIAAGKTTLVLPG
jgi:hypothetical protein